MSLRHRLFDNPYLLLCLTTLFWSGNFVLGRAMHETVPPVALAFWRWVGALILVLPFALPTLRQDIATTLKNWPLMLVLALTGVATFNTFVYLGLQTTQAINALLLQSTMPVMIILASFVLFRERLTVWKAVGVAVSLCGVIWIVAKGDIGTLTTLAFTRGDLWIAAAVVLYALYSALLRKRPAMPLIGFVAISFFLGSVMLLPVYLYESVVIGRPVDWTISETWITIAYVVIFPSVLSFLFFNRGVELIGANAAGMFMHLMPVFGSIMAVLFLDERFALFHAVGVVLILSGIILATKNQQAAAAVPRAKGPA